MTCNKHGCRQAFHVTCAQFAGLLCEEEGNGADNVQYCGYCKYHFSKLVSDMLSTSMYSFMSNFEKILNASILFQVEQVSFLLDERQRHRMDLDNLICN
ncbi:UNVERIFIED_CONTAM: hypothetical protein K2H54_027455 [Gekko kuhli]